MNVPTTAPELNPNHYAVALCLDGGEPISVLAAIQKIHHLRADGAACLTPDDEMGFLSSWRHPSHLELEFWHRWDQAGRPEPPPDLIPGWGELVRGSRNNRFYSFTLSMLIALSTHPKYSGMTFEEIHAFFMKQSRTIHGSHE